MRVIRRIHPEVAKGTPADISYYECDVSDWEQVKKVAEIVVKEVRSRYYLMTPY